MARVIEDTRFALRGFRRTPWPPTPTPFMDGERTLELNRGMVTGNFGAGTTRGLSHGTSIALLGAPTQLEQ